MQDLQTQSDSEETIFSDLQVKIGFDVIGMRIFES